MLSKVLKALVSPTKVVIFGSQLTIINLPGVARNTWIQH